MLIISLILKQRFFSLFFLIFSLLKALFTESAADLDKEHVSPLWLSVFKSVHHFSFPFLINGSNSCSFYSWYSFYFHLCYCLLLLSDLLMHCYHHFNCISNQLLNWLHLLHPPQFMGHLAQIKRISSWGSLTSWYNLTKIGCIFPSTSFILA